jgi:hypothetical protein
MTKEDIEAWIKDDMSDTENKQRKDKLGEVFTPLELVNKVLDLFPKSVWSDPSRKWLEPSAGKGNFAMCVYSRLMDGLQKVKPNKLERSNWIINNMLYMAELSKSNCNKLRKLFGSNCNLFCGDFLAYNNSNVSLFDCIVGNPPFQDDYGLTNEGKRILGGKSKLYERIFLKAYSLLEVGGLLAFVVPVNMFTGFTDSYKVLTESSVPFVSVNRVKKFFPSVQLDIGYFLLKKGKPSTNTIIEGTDGKRFHTRLVWRSVNPVSNWTKSTDLLVRKYIKSEKNGAIYNRGKPVSAYKGSKYEVVYSPSRMLHTNNKELAAGLNQPKAIIFAISPELDFVMDYKGTKGAGPNTFYVPFDTIAEGKRLEAFLKSDVYRELALATKTTRQYLKHAFIQYVDFFGQRGNRHTRKVGKNKLTKTRKRL